MQHVLLILILYLRKNKSLKVSVEYVHFNHMPEIRDPRARLLYETALHKLFKRFVGSLRNLRFKLLVDNRNPRNNLGVLSLKRQKAVFIRLTDP